MIIQGRREALLQLRRSTTDWHRTSPAASTCSRGSSKDAAKLAVLSLAEVSCMPMVIEFFRVILMFQFQPS
jgi:hypothetical protein